MVRFNVNKTLGGAKDEYFSCFLSSCQLGFKKISGNLNENGVKTSTILTHLINKHHGVDWSIFWSKSFDVIDYH